jgi:hypothetical protein
VEQCRREGNENGVYLYHVADMSDPEAGNELIKVGIKCGVLLLF